MTDKDFYILQEMEEIRQTLVDAQERMKQLQLLLCLPHQPDYTLLRRQQERENQQLKQNATIAWYLTFAAETDALAQSLAVSSDEYPQRGE